MNIVHCKEFGPEGSAVIDAVKPWNPFAVTTFSWLEAHGTELSAGIMLKTDDEWFNVIVQRIGIHIANCRVNEDYVTDIVKISKEECTIFVRTSTTHNF